jgi:hypothetical protein
MNPAWGSDGSADNFWSGDGGWVYDKGGFQLYILPYMEQDNLFQQVARFDLYTPKIDTITRAIYHNQTGAPVDAGQGVIPQHPPYHRCPSDSTGQGTCEFSNYIGNGDLQDWTGSWSYCGQNHSDHSTAMEPPSVTTGGARRARGSPACSGIPTTRQRDRSTWLPRPMGRRIPSCSAKT